MRIAQAFDAIETGEVDDFAFEITTRVGRSLIVNTDFICRLTTFSDGADLDPGARVSNATFSNTGLYYRDQNNELQFAQGYFAIARLGAMPVSAAGGTYILGYKAFLDDGRIVQGSSTVQCVLQGS